MGKRYEGRGEHARLCKECRLVNKKMKATSALSASRHDEEKGFRHRPTQGWTVDEAKILLPSSIYSPTVQPWVGRWRHTVCPPGKQNETCTWGIFFSLVNTVRLQSDLSILHFPYQHTFSGKKDGERLCHAIFKASGCCQTCHKAVTTLP